MIGVGRFLNAPYSTRLISSYNSPNLLTGVQSKPMAKLPISEDKNEDRLSRIRRRRARGLSAPMDADERETFFRSLARRAAPSFDFFLFSVVAGVILSIGLIADQPALILLGVLFAPLMTPIVGMALGTTLGNLEYFGRSLAGLLVGCFLVFFFGFLAGIAAANWFPVPATFYVMSKFFARLSFTHFLVLGIGSALTTFWMAKDNRRAIVPNVATTFLLYSPLAVAGFGITANLSNTSGPTLLLSSSCISSSRFLWGRLFS